MKKHARIKTGKKVTKFVQQALLVAIILKILHLAQKFQRFNFILVFVPKIQ